MSDPRNGRGPSRPLRESQKQQASRQPTSTGWQSFWGAIRAGPRFAFVRAEMGIPAPLPDRLAVHRRRARAREPHAENRREADTALPVSRLNLISAPLFGVSCRQKTAEQNYYNRFSRIETVPSWFGCQCSNTTRSDSRPRLSNRAQLGSLLEVIFP